MITKNDILNPRKWYQWLIVAIPAQLICFLAMDYFKSNMYYAAANGSLSDLIIQFYMVYFVASFCILYPGSNFYRYLKNEGTKHKYPVLLLLIIKWIYVAGEVVSLCNNYSVLFK